MVDDGGKLDELHEDMLEVLDEGRATPSYLGDRLDESRQLMSNRLRDLRMSGDVRKVHKGLYERVDDSDDDDDTHRDSEPDETLAQRVRDADWTKTNYKCRESRVQAIVAALEKLREEGRCKTPDLVEILDDRLGGGSNNQRMLSDITKQLDVVESPKSGQNEYFWLGE